MARITKLSVLLGFCAVALPRLSLAGTVTVNANSSIYSPAGGTADGTAAIPITVNSAGSFTFNATGARYTINGGGNYNDADGVGGAVSSSSNTGYGSQSGITAPDDGYLVGVFVAGTESGTAPASLTYTTSSITNSSFSPLLDQTFFIGDGLTGDGTGSSQTFDVPNGATTLYLGISDACGYNGGPSCYGDNYGSFNVSYTAHGAMTGSATPEPSSLALLGTGLLGVAGTIRRRFPKVA